MSAATNDDATGQQSRDTMAHTPGDEGRNHRTRFASCDAPPGGAATPAYTVASKTRRPSARGGLRLLFRPPWCECTSERCRARRGLRKRRSALDSQKVAPDEIVLDSFRSALAVGLRDPLMAPCVVARRGHIKVWIHDLQAVGETIRSGAVGRPPAARGVAVLPHRVVRTRGVRVEGEVLAP